MDAAAELGRNPVSKHQIQPEYEDEQADTGRDCRTRFARPNSQARTNSDRETSIDFPCSADHVQDWQPYPVDPYSCSMCYINTYIHSCEKWCPADNLSPLSYNTLFVFYFDLFFPLYSTVQYSTSSVCVCGGGCTAMLYLFVI